MSPLLRPSGPSSSDRANPPAPTVNGDVQRRRAMLSDSRAGGSAGLFPVHRISTLSDRPRSSSICFRSATRPSALSPSTVAENRTPSFSSAPLLNLGSSVSARPSRSVHPAQSLRSARSSPLARPARPAWSSPLARSAQSTQSAGVRERHEAVAGPDLVLHRLPGVGHPGLEPGPIRPVEVPAQNPLGDLPGHPLPGQHQLHLVPQTPPRLLDAPHQRCRIEPRGLAAPVHSGGNCARRSKHQSAYAFDTRFQWRSWPASPNSRRRTTSLISVSSLAIRSLATRRITLVMGPRGWMRMHAPEVRGWTNCGHEPHRARREPDAGGRCPPLLVRHAGNDRGPRLGNRTGLAGNLGGLRGNVPPFRRRDFLTHHERRARARLQGRWIGDPDPLTTYGNDRLCFQRFTMPLQHLFHHQNSPCHWNVRQPHQPRVRHSMHEHQLAEIRVDGHEYVSLWTYPALVDRSPHCSIPYRCTLNARPAPEPPPAGVGSSGTGHSPCFPPRSHSRRTSASRDCASRTAT